MFAGSIDHQRLCRLPDHHDHGAGGSSGWNSFTEAQRARPLRGDARLHATRVSSQHRVGSHVSQFTHIKLMLNMKHEHKVSLSSGF